MEWILGITDTHPTQWKKKEPCWDDEQLTATSSHTFQQVVTKLCETALKNRHRDDNDSGIDDHIWNLKLMKRQPEYDKNSKGEDDSSAKVEASYRGSIFVLPRRHHQSSDLYQDEQETQHPLLLPSETTQLSQSLLPQGRVIHFTYNFGTCINTTELFMKVLKVHRPAADHVLGERNPLQYFEAKENAAKEQQDLEAVPAYGLPKQHQIDTHYPYFSKAFLGNYEPLHHRRGDGAQEGGDNHVDVQLPSVGSATWGLSSRIRSENDTTFCTMEKSDCTSDLFFSSQPFSEMSEFLNVAERAWTPRCSPHNNDPDHLESYRYNMVSRHIFPSNRQGDKMYNHMLKHSQSDNAHLCGGPKILLFRSHKVEDTKEEKDASSSSFNFAQVFPQTHAHFQSGKFRWFKYKQNNGVLHVLVGRGTGKDNRDFGNHQVLRTWRRKFVSLHDLLCAVEASWVHQTKILSADTVLSVFDMDLGPSSPDVVPREPPIFGTKDDVVVVTKCNDMEKKFVTTIAISLEDDGETMLYSGHADGTLVKWCLDDNSQIWSKQIYSDGTDDFPHFCKNTGMIKLQGTAGVAGLVVRRSGKNHLVFSWTDAYSGYPEEKLRNRGPAEVKCWNGKDGGYVRSYACDVGLDVYGKPAYPSISTVVFCRLWVESEWVESMVVGLHCTCEPLDWKGDYSRFDKEEAQRLGEGNIVPFWEHSNGRAMETWREHRGIIRAMAVIPDQYLLSYSIQKGRGFPDAMVLWSLKQPGVPLCSYAFRDSSTSRLNTRLDAVVGVSVCGTNVLFASQYGDQIAAVSVQDDEGYLSLKLHGYGNIGNRCGSEGSFQGTMAMAGKIAVMSNEGSGDVWLFDIKGTASHDKLDKRDGNPREFDEERCENDSVEAPSFRFSGRELAVGKVVFPLFGTNSPQHKKRKIGDGGLWSSERGQGEGGPVALAHSGKWLVGGFSNGSIVRAPVLPDQFADTDSVAALNGLVSCSHLPSDKWYCPFLESDDVGEDDDDEYNEAGPGKCTIQ